MPEGVVAERGNSRSRALSPDFDNPFSIAGGPTRVLKKAEHLALDETAGLYFLRSVQLSAIGLPS